MSLLRFHQYPWQRGAKDQDYGGPQAEILCQLPQEIHAAEAETLHVSMVVRIDMARLALNLTAAVENLWQKTRMFFYGVMLWGYRCPKCQGRLHMIREGRCRCDGCGHQFDPTIQFQRCLACGGPIKLRIRRYCCQQCGRDVASRFLFEGLVFDPAYFRVKMAQARQRKKELKEKVRKMLAECRSEPLSLAATNLEASPGLIEALNGLTGRLDTVPLEIQTHFDLHEYQVHIMSKLNHGPVELREIPPLIGDARVDLIWRFIAIVFLGHAGLVDIHQEGELIWVTKHETDRERQDIPGELEESHGIERSVGGVEAG